jgi:hypothetical protein
MKMARDPIDIALGLRSLNDSGDDNQLPVEIQETQIVVVNPESDETIQDIEIARKNIKNIIEIGDSTLDKLVSLAKDSESPRAYEVVSGMMKTLLDANRDFVDMSMKKKFHKEELVSPKETAQTNVTNNNLILSTSDLLKMIKGESE